jgi:hypothetical protein
MKTSSDASRGTQQSKRGMAVIIVLAFLAIILIYLAGNARTLYWLERDLKVVEKKQVQRLGGMNIKTNSVGTAPYQSAPTNASKPQ